MNDPVKLLKKDHRTVKGLFRKFERAGGREKQKLAQEIIEELSVHATIEEQLVYPALRKGDARKEHAVLNALEEHHAAKLILAELDRMKIDDERYDAKMHVVRESVEMHIDEEEEQLLPRLETLLEPDDKKQLAAAMTAMKQSAPNHPHPAAPDTPPGGTVAGFLARIADTGKDVVRKVSSRDKAAGHRRVTRRAESAAQSASRAKSGTKAKTKRRAAGRRRTAGGKTTGRRAR